MINPIINHPAAIAADPTLLVAESLAQQPEPAVQVTGTEEVLPNGLPASQLSGKTQQGATRSSEQRISLEKALEQANDKLKAWSTGMRFDVDEDTQRVVISIVDTDTGEVLRTVPSDSVLRVAKIIVQLQGASINTTA
jgi:flagellar protein FlaG